MKGITLTENLGSLALTDVRLPSVGQYPYNVVTKFAPLNLTYPGTKHYQCNLSEAYCESDTGAIIPANVTRAVA